MCILNDKQIKKYIDKGYIHIFGMQDNVIQPNSMDVTLEDYCILKYSNGKECDETIDIDEHGYVMQHGDCILASTYEYIELRDKVCAEVSGKSTIGRHFVSVHVTAGWIDTGFKGQITLELVNHGAPFEIYGGMPIAQLVFFKCKKPKKQYNGHYQNQSGPTLPWR